MLGIPMEHRRSMVLAVSVLLAVGCVKNVKPDAHTGKDGRYKGARAVTLDPMTNEGEVKGVVSYPGGDRIDWKSVALPEGKKGKVTFELSWKPPRPGLDLAFEVYDQYGQKLGGVKPKKPSAAKKSKKKRGKKSISFDNARGTLYVEVYASNRGDAGAYRLAVTFEEAKTETQPVFDPGTVSIPMPPKLAAVPPPCVPTAIDPANPECKGVSPPCDPKAPDPANPNCKGVTKPCDPNALDPLNPACLPYYPECDPLKIDTKNPKCNGVKPPPAEPINADVVATETSGSGTVITINVGAKEGVDTKWKGTIVDSGGKPVDKGDFTVFKVKDHSCFAKVKLAKATVDKNLAVRLTPP